MTNIICKLGCKKVLVDDEDRMQKVRGNNARLNEEGKGK